MIEIIEILKITLPPVIVGLVVYVILKKQHEKELKLIGLFQSKSSNEVNASHAISTPNTWSDQMVILPLKLQAFEKVTTFLERIEPSNLVMHIHKPGMSGKLLHADLLKAIREEFDLIVAQQIYISNNGWNLIKQAKEETINIVNTGLSRLDDDATGIDLSRAIFETMMALEQSPSTIATNYVKQELQQNISI